MKAQRTVSRLALASGAALVIAVFAWLMFGLGGWRAGLRQLPDGDGSRLEVFAKQDAQLTLTDVTGAPVSAWRPWTGPGYLLAEHGGVIWARATLRNPDVEPRQGVLADTSYFSDRVDMWSADGAGGWRHAASGESVAGSERPLWGRTAAFPVTVPASGERVVYLRVRDYYVPHMQPRWWPRAEDFFAALVRDMLAEGICYGALLGLILYNVVLWTRLRFSDTGYYVLYASTGAAYNFVGNGGLALLGLNVGSPGRELILAATMGLTGVCVMQFARVFLGTGERLPRVDRFLGRWRMGLVGLLLGVPVMPWWPTPQWLNVLIVVITLTHLLCLGVAVAAWRRGAQHARFFVAAFGLLFVGILPAATTWLMGDVLASAAMGMLAGATLEMIVLSFAVADRFAHTQRQLVEETEQRRAIEEAYADELETEVRERTRELQQANADKDRMLTVVGHDLRGPLTGLMRSADETSGDFAREVVRTGRALLLLIEDLVLWARLRAGTRHLAVHPASGIGASAVALHRVLAEHGGIELVVDVPEHVHVKTDLVLAQTLVRNLLANALKFAETRVILRATAGVEGGVRFSVGNDGPPLPADVAERFAAGKDEPITATGGLGLRLCREICSALGTRLEAGSTTNGGTEFNFVLKMTTKTGEQLA